MSSTTGLFVHAGGVRRGDGRRVILGEVQLAVAGPHDDVAHQHVECGGSGCVMLIQTLVRCEHMKRGYKAQLDKLEAFLAR